ncbi:MAG: hypothetical protein GKR87_10985 [Kiritimatiellae bacterium]|nr:hypothetical protein [Kiritimatiellia bacterium]
MPKHIFEGIPASAHNSETRSVRSMVHGDHLQIEYHFWLFSEMLTGKTPLFYNLYEFNTGDDKQRYVPGPYFAPISLIYTLGAFIGGRAFGVNMAVFISLWLTYFFTWLFVRRYTPDHFVAGTAALLGLVLPYRWITLLGGSPTGYAMMWVPLLLLGIDMAVREKRWSGGLLAGLTILLTYLTCLQVFFFSVLFIPCWCVITFFIKYDFKWKEKESYIKLTMALFPLVILLGLTVFLSLITTKSLSDSTMSAGRHFQEIALFSPKIEGLFSWKPGLSNKIYIGLCFGFIFFTGSILSVFHAVRNRTINRWNIFFAITCALGSVGIFVLALGPNGPYDGVILDAARKLIPPYKMIRQPTKIFCLVPSLLAVLSVPLLKRWLGIYPGRMWRNIFLIGFATCLTLEFSFRFHPSICLLDTEQEAYKAMAQDAVSKGQNPHILAIPLWPGDTAWSSLYEYYVSLYHIRMINGYSPAVRTDYKEKIFNRFSSADKGDLSEKQLDTLLDMGVGYIVLHENAFPEKVSPFPVAFTLKALLNHPRLSLLKQTGPVWAFEILKTGEKRPLVAETWNSFFPTRYWEMEKGRNENTSYTSSHATDRHGYLTVSVPGSWIEIPSTEISPAPSLRWLIRLKGQGTLNVYSMLNAQRTDPYRVSVQESHWIWEEVPADVKEHTRIALRIEHQKGTVDLDSALLMAGDWAYINVGEELSLPAPCFFHAGYTDLKTDSVLFRPTHERDETIFYGPKLPFKKGTYAIDLYASSSAKEGTYLGAFHVAMGPQRSSDFDVIAGQRARGYFTQTNNLPVRLNFRYSRNADLAISNVVFSRVKPKI